MPEETSAAEPDADEAEPPSTVPRPPRRQRQRIALIVGVAVAAMAVAVAVIALTASPANPYAAPQSVCALVKPATVAKFVTGKTHRQSGATSCQWQGSTGDDLIVAVDVLSDAEQARRTFTTYVKNTEHEKVNAGTTATYLGTRTVTGLGDQATVAFQALTTASFKGKHINEADLIIRSRNAVIQVIRLTSTVDAARLPGPALVPGAAATARDVLAAMPTLGPGSPGVGVHISLDVSHPVGVVILGDPGRGDQHRGIAE